MSVRVVRPASSPGAPTSGASGSTGADEVLPDPLGDERRQRRHQPVSVRRGSRAGRERRRVAVPEPAAGAADVPVGQVVDELARAACRPAGCRRPRAPSVTSRISRCSSDSSHRSSTGRSATGGASGCRASSRSSGRTARGTRRCSSRSAAPCGRSPAASSCPTRRAAHGDPDAAMNQRTASAPCSSISGIGSRMLPRCLDILRPSSARIRPRQTTFSYDDRSNTSVPTAISE